MSHLRVFWLMLTIIALCVGARPPSANAQGQTSGTADERDRSSTPTTHAAAPCSSGKAPAPGEAALPAIPRATRPNQPLIVRIVVEQPYIDNQATRVTYNGLDHVFGIEWQVDKTTGQLKVPEAMVSEKRVFSDILDCTDKGVSIPERFTPLTAPRLFPYLIAVREKWTREFDESLAASTKIAAVALILSLRTSAIVEAAPAMAAGKPAPMATGTNARPATRPSPRSSIDHTVSGAAKRAKPLSDEALAQLSPQMRKSVRSWEAQLARHRDKLDAYRQNPDAFDNKGFLRNAPTPEIRQRIIDTRIHHLEGEIRNFERQIADALGAAR